MDSLKQFSSIKQISQKLSIPKPTLRFWEKEFKGILIPLRTNGAQRRYTPEHVSIIEKIKSLKEARLSLVEIKGKLGKGQIAEAGNQWSEDERTNGIVLLAERMAKVVKMEVRKFFERAER